MIKLTALFLSAVILVFPAGADLLILKDGTEINGTLKSYNGQSVTFFNRDREKDVVIQREQLNRADLYREYEEKGAYKIDEIGNQDIRKILKNPPDLSQYENHQSVTLMERTFVRYELDGTTVYRYHFLGKVFKEPGKDIGTFYISYTPDESEFKILYARSITDGKIIYANDYSVTDSSRYASYPLYEKARSIKVIIPKVEIGSFVEYCYEKKYLKRDLLDEPQCFSDSIFSSIPVLSYRVEIDTPAGMNFAAAAYNNGPKFSQRTEGSRIIRTYEVKDIKPYDEEDNLPPARDFAPAMSFGPQWDYRDIAEALERKYAAQSRQIPQALSLKCRELTKGTGTTDQKIAALYSYLTRSIKTAGVSPSDTQYYPLNPEQVYAGKQASPVDKNFLLHLMLKEVGIESDILLIHNLASGKLEHFATDIENFGSFALRLADGRFVYAARDDMTLFCLPDVLHGTKALSLGEKKIIDIPHIHQVYSETFKCSLNESGDLEVSARQDFIGNSQNAYRSHYYQSREELDRDWTQRIARIHPRASLVKYGYENLDDLSRNLAITYSYSADEYPKKAGDKMMAFRMPELYFFSASSVGKEQRLYPIFFSAPVEWRFHYEITVPESFRWAFVPEKLVRDIDGMKITASFDRKSDTELAADYVFYRGTGFKSEDYAKYKKLVEEIVRMQEQWLLIEKK
ncbi:MAG: DUF3857 domain-containing protein [Candidatus Wallbacteria bacterium]|nr:DUF3857 domain-containing protein [Candidatus Wallbacteria bacterium]